MAAASFTRPLSHFRNYLGGNNNNRIWLPEAAIKNELPGAVGRGRDGSYLPPAQIRACGTIAAPTALGAVLQYP